MIGYILCGAVACAALFVAFSERLRVRVYRIPSGLPARIVQVSDLHDCVFGTRQEKLISAVVGAKPDLIVLTGDIVNDTPERVGKVPILSEEHPVREFLDGIRGVAPVYMVYGNHEANIENIAELSRELSSLGVRLIGGKSEIVHINGRDIRICGIDDPRFFGAGKQKMTLSERLSDDADRDSPGLLRWREELEKLPSGGIYTLLLSHRPEEFAFYERFDLTFSGHAHGGQWRLPPFINGVYAPHQGIFPKHAGGLYRVGGGFHVVSRGLSKIRCPRIFNRPEVCVVLPEN